MSEEARRLWQEKLDDYLAEEALATDPARSFQLKKLIQQARAKLAELSGGGQDGPEGPRVEIARLPLGTADFLGRGEELRMLDAAWAGEGDGAGVQIVALVAPGGVGKTALVKRWLDGLRRDGWRGAQRVFGWSFYSQGTGDDRQASDDGFLTAALDWFEVEINPAASPWDKGLRLAQAVAARRTLLILDGCEPLQQPPGPLGGQLRTPGLKALLGHLAGSGQRGLTLLTTREAFTDLAEYARSPGYPEGAVLGHDLGRLDERDGARLLHRLGCVRAGAAAIGPEDAELRAASRGGPGPGGAGGDGGRRRPPAGTPIPGAAPARVAPGRLARGAPAALCLPQGVSPSPTRGTGRAPAALPGGRPWVPGGVAAGGTRRGLSRPHPAGDRR